MPSAATYSCAGDCGTATPSGGCGGGGGGGCGSGDGGGCGGGGGGGCGDI